MPDGIIQATWFLFANPALNALDQALREGLVTDRMNVNDFRSPFIGSATFAWVILGGTLKIQSVAVGYRDQGSIAYVQCN